MKDKKICIVDYGVSNVYSLFSAIKYLGYSISVDTDGTSLSNSEVIFIPGVCSFGTGINALNKRGQSQSISQEAKKGKPIIGLCLGAQMLLENSEESLGFQGLNLVPGKVVRISANKGFKVPNQNWHRIKFIGNEETVGEFPESIYYFSHSYEMVIDPKIDYVYQIGDENSTIIAAFKYLNFTGIQFHPELSGESGLRLLDILLA